MHTLFGPEAKEGDYVAVQDVQYMRGSADILVARVHGNKAYAASCVPCRVGHRWLRKETAIIIIDPDDVSKEAKQLIDMNIEAPKTTFPGGTDYSATVWKLSHEACEAEKKMREERNGKQE